MPRPKSNILRQKISYTVNKNIDGDDIDIPKQLLFVCFTVLQNFVDTHLVDICSRERAAELHEYLLVDEEEQWYVTEDDAPISLDHLGNFKYYFAAEFYELYDWWVEERPERENTLQRLNDRCPDIPDDWDDDWDQHPEKYESTFMYKALMRWEEEYDQLVEQFELEDADRLAQLMSLHRFMLVQSYDTATQDQLHEG